MSRCVTERESKTYRVSFNYHKPQSLEEAWQLKREDPQAHFVAGGTDVMVKIRHGALRPMALISLRAIKDLALVTEDAQTIRLGAITTIRQLLEHPSLQQHLPLLVEAATRLGSPQIRNVATLAGNLCNASPCADTATPLLAYEAEIEIRNPATQRRLPLYEFFQAPQQTCLAFDEIVTALCLPIPSAQAHTAFYKKGRVRMDLALVSLSVLLEMDGPFCRKARLAAGSVGPTPLRLFAAEELLEKHHLDDPERIAQAVQCARRIISPISDLRASADYRRHLLGVYLQRAIASILAGAPL